MTLVAINDNGELLCEVKTESNRAGLERFFHRFNQPVQAAVECTSYWYWVADWWQAHEIALQLAHAKMLKAISYGKVKTDSVDARTLADLLRAGLIPTAYKTDGPQRDLRELTRARLRMIDRPRKLQGSLWQLAAKYNVLVQDVGWRYLDRLEEFLTDSLPEVVHLEAQLLVGQIRQFQNHIIALESAIEQQVDFHEDVERLLVVPGFGRVVSWTILAEVGDIGRFPSSKQPASYCRLVAGAARPGQNPSVAPAGKPVA